MATAGVSIPGVGIPGTQIVYGNQLQPYTKEWYDAQDANSVRQAGVQGTAQGTGEANYYKALGIDPSMSGLFAAAGYGGSGSLPSVSTPDRLSYGSMGGGGSTATQPVATIAPVNFDAANAAAFARAKDQASSTASASMRGLQQALAARGLTGGGYEAGQIGNTLARESNTIGEASRAEAQHEADLAAQAAGENLQAGVAQRGQTISQEEADANRNAAAEEAAFSGGIAQRGQDIGAAESNANRTADLAKFRASQTLALLRNVIGQPNINVPYVY